MAPARLRKHACIVLDDLHAVRLNTRGTSPRTPVDSSGPVPRRDCTLEMRMRRRGAAAMNLPPATCRESIAATAASTMRPLQAAWLCSAPRGGRDDRAGEPKHVQRGRYTARGTDTRTAAGHVAATAETHGVS
ncbi:hypothetical protein OH76DRAFT_1410527 [Lentinus brumalis]|uniref:Uncharacterized protein n=1 Tax=Lentinus brumalis TaxID=2498619 RepID=A0A371CS70_9APHY|nr:hypothetical protein OH76DRAFT_1410527 [Polyporus brumalis]